MDEQIEFISLGETDQLLCKGHIDPDIAIREATNYLRREWGNHCDDSIEVLTPEKVHHTIARCIPVSPHDDNYGDFDWWLYTNQKPGRGAFKATIIDL